MGDVGKPAYTDGEYQQWLTDMTPYLKQGSSLYYAIGKAGLSKHKNVIYRYYRSNDEYREKIDVFKTYPGELVNNFFNNEVSRIVDKQKVGQPITEEEYKTMRWFAEKHRSSQAFFTNRQETVPMQPVDLDKIMDELEKEDDPSGFDYNKEFQNIPKDELEKMKEPGSETINDAAYMAGKMLEAEEQKRQAQIIQPLQAQAGETQPTEQIQISPDPNAVTN